MEDFRKCFLDRLLKINIIFLGVIPTRTLFLQRTNFDMKQILAALLALAMVFCFCGCGSDEEKLPNEEQIAESQQEMEHPNGDPQKALDEIYAQLVDRSTGLMNATYKEVEDIFLSLKG